MVRIVPIQNHGNQCFLNVIIQSLFVCGGWIPSLMMNPKTDPTLDLLKMFVRMYYGATGSISNALLLEVFKTRRIEVRPYEQNDASEYMLHLLHILTEYCPKELFNVDLEKDTESILCVQYSERLIESIMKRLEEQRVQNWPKYLHIHINRYNERMQKIHDPIECPIRWDWYELRASIVHIGGERNGHYVIFVRDNDNYIMIDDERIQLMDEERFMHGIRQSYMVVYERN
jgi:ubiquitin C-terminal hydrolase